MQKLKSLVLTMLLLAGLASAEPLKTFTVTTDTGTVVTLTKDLPDKFFGDYLQKDGQWQWKYHFDKTGESWFQEQIQDSSGNYTFENAPKIIFTEWGVVVEDGKLKEISEKTMRWGKNVTLKGMELIYKRLGEYRSERVLTEEDGKYSIKFANKVD